MNQLRRRDLGEQRLVLGAPVAHPGLAAGMHMCMCMCMCMCLSMCLSMCMWPTQVCQRAGAGGGREVAAHARLCCVCLQAERTTLLMPCRHVVLCAACATHVVESETARRCPLCRVGIEGTMRIYQ